MNYGLGGHLRSLKLVPYENVSTVSYSHSITTMALSLAVLTHYANVTASYPARQTSHDCIGRACA